MGSSSSWSLRFDTAGFAWLDCDVAGISTNVLSAIVLKDLAFKLAEIRARGPMGLVVRSAKANGFVAGADVKEFLGIASPEEGYALVRAGQAIVQQLEDLPCPSVAVLHGFVLGGGLELALACSYRIGIDDDSLSLGLPEVLLGIHPGFGGTVRSVRTIGVRAAFDLMLKGRPLRGAQALAVGLIDELVERGRQDERAKELLTSRPARRTAPWLDRILTAAPLRAFIASRTSAILRRTARRDHYPAPYAIVDLWRNHAGRGASAYEAEARSISALLCSPASRNLVRIFLLQDRLKALGAPGATFRHVHVIGAGVMGGDIAAWAAYRGMTVTLQDRSEELIRPALSRAKTFLQKRLKNPAAARQAEARLTMDAAGDGVARADVVIEVIVEDLEAKRALYARIEPKLRPGAILASNTSSIMIETLCERLADPSRLVGIHFFNPVAQLQLVEVVRGSRTRPEIVEGALQFIRALDRLPLPCRSAPGFVVNRILTPYINEALFALESGIARELIDRAAVRFGMPMGPIELSDVVGLDVSLHVGRVLAEAFGRPIPAVLTDLVEQRKLGRKSGEGFYRWIDGKAQKRRVEDAAIPADLEDRLILPLLNEAAACLREGVIADADLLDAGSVFATGFAPFRGGPLRYARDRGVANVVQRLRELERTYGARFRPDAGWQDSSR